MTGETNVLGTVSGRYTILQNRDGFELAQQLVNSHGANIVSAGGLFDDRRTFVTLRLPDALAIGDDPYTLFLTLLNSHDGSTALTAAVTPVRVVCANTARAALKRARYQWSARHTAGLVDRVDEARRTLNLAANTPRHSEPLASSCSAGDSHGPSSTGWCRPCYR